MNSLNVLQTDGGLQVKQGDFGSRFAFKLLDEAMQAMPDLEGRGAVIKLGKIWQTTGTVTNGEVSFYIDKVLPWGGYVLEIIVGEYVFPSDRRTKISVIRAITEYQPAELVSKDGDLAKFVAELKAKFAQSQSGTYDDSEIKRQITELSSKIGQPSTYDDSELRRQIQAVSERLSQQVDNDTIYDDTALRERLERLESKPDNDTIYDDAGLKLEIEQLKSSIESLPKHPYDDRSITERLTSLESKQDKDTIYDDSDVRHRLSELEKREDKDTVYDDNSVKQRLAALEQRRVTDEYYDAEVMRRLNQLEHQTPVITRWAGKKPTNYIVESDGTTHTIIFDNGAKLQGAITPGWMGVGNGYYGANTAGFSNVPLQQSILVASVGTASMSKFESGNTLAAQYSENLVVIDPVNDSKQYDFSSAKYNPKDTHPGSLNNQQNLIKIWYELGVFDEEQIIKYGAVKL